MPDGLTIGNLRLDVPFYQAPLSGYTDRAMRRLAWRFGSPLSFTGVLLDKVLLCAKAVRKLHLEPTAEEGPVGVQILGADAETMAAAARVVEAAGFAAVDLNFACPAPKVLRRGRGGALLDQPSRLLAIYRQVRRAVRLPVLVKLRIGVDGGEASREAFWQICEGLAEDPPDAVVIHGRTVAKKYRGRADWAVAAAVKQRWPQMVVIGSGDVTSAEAVRDRVEDSGLDGVVIARGAIGNPWIFRESRALLEGRQPGPPPELREVGEVMRRHFEWILELYPERKAVPFFRKFAAHYCRRHPQRKTVLLEMMGAKTAEELGEIIRRRFGG